MDKLGKIHQLHQKEHLLISKTANFESDLLKTKENIAPQNRKIL